MMLRFYAPRLRGSSRSSGALLWLVLTACGGAAANAPAISAQTRAQIERAQDAERQRDYHRARAHYQRAVDEAPDAASAALATREMASALIFWGEYEGARALLMQSLEHDERQVQVWHDLGILQSRTGQLDAARASLERAVKLAPAEPRSRIALAALLVKARQYRQAQAQYRELLRLDIPPRIARAARKALGMLAEEISREAGKR